MVGFFATCDKGTEKRCIKELFNILNDYVEKCYPNLDVQAICKENKAKVDKEKLEQAKLKASAMEAKKHVIVTSKEPEAT